MLRAAPIVSFTSEPDASEADADRSSVVMAYRDNILTCIAQWAAANARGGLRQEGKVGTVDDNCIANLLEEVDWVKMPASRVLAIIDFIIALCDSPSIARMAGAADQERECLRRVLAQMADDGFEVIDIDDVRGIELTDAEVA